MQATQRILREISAAVATTVALGWFGIACEREPTRPASVRSVSALALPPAVSDEGELFGNVYSNGTSTKDATYYVTLRPFDSKTALRLNHFDSTAWADTAVGNAGGGAPRWMYEWTDPKAAGKCGNLAMYLDSTPQDTVYRPAEAHRPGPNQAPSGFEKHCIRPGTYQFTLTHGGSVVKSFIVDYPAITPATRGVTGAKLVWNTTAGKSEALDDSNYNDTANVWQDLVVQVDVTGGSFQETNVLDVQNALSHLFADTFTNNPTPSGSEADYFRLSVARSTSTWHILNQAEGALLTRLFYDYGRKPLDRTGYYDPNGGASVHSLLRFHTYAELTQSEADTTAVELMRPDEGIDSMTVARRVIQITRSAPFPCSTFEGDTTWQTTDQYWSAGCSARGADIQYRWQTDVGGPWTGYSSDTLLDFLGHSTVSTHQVTLDVHSTTTGQSGFTVTNVIVRTGQIVLNGATYVTSKATQTYTSNHNGIWYERYDPALHWYPASANAQETLKVIWPAGAYTDQLRQDSSLAGVLRRGRLTITVCDPPDSCQGSSSAPSPASGWNVFGAGPWLSCGPASSPRSVRLYDLWGMHDSPSSFSDASWVTDTGGVVSDLAGTWGVRWVTRSQSSANARVFQFDATSPPGLPMVFGMAIDPDIGANAADDVSGFDNSRGMTYATDGNAAVGFLLRDSVGSAVYGVQQYSRSHPAPVLTADVWSAQRVNGVHLVSGSRDVQLSLASGPATGTSHYWFVVVRGATLASIQATADSVIGGLSGVTWR